MKELLQIFLVQFIGTEQTSKPYEGKPNGSKFRNVTIIPVLKELQELGLDPLTCLAGEPRDISVFEDSSNYPLLDKIKTVAGQVCTEKLNSPYFVMSEDGKTPRNYPANYRIKALAGKPIIANTISWFRFHNESYEATRQRAIGRAVAHKVPDTELQLYKEHPMFLDVATGQKFTGEPETGEPAMSV